MKNWRYSKLQRIMIQVEVPDQVPTEDLIDQVGILLIEELGATIISARVVSPTHSLTLS
jgi:hypothetical protein